jgi:hypothetical protein
MAWLPGQRFGAASRGRHLWFRLMAAAIVLAAAVYGLPWAYVECEAHRAETMLAEASRVQVGDAEASILPLVRRYDGLKWRPEHL